MAINSKRKNLMRNAAAGALAAAMFATPSQAIVPNDNFTPTDIIDDTGVNGVGMFFRNDGFVCSGTLINPRTVLFAAHCVNSNPESDFAEGNLRSAFSFDDNALPGFLNWINGDTDNGNVGFQSHPDMFVYNISQIYYDPRSLADPNAFGFLEADIALAALSDPARNVPTWALLFSPLPAPDQITDQDGTGYHVNITGYGRSGSGTTGASQGIDWRRRAAENMLGALTSFDDRNNFLFGQPFGDLPQVLYRLDFDDPNKTNPFDFNLYKDEPREREGTTAGGDSGGPLILDAANNNLSTENLQIGVLSGGSRFFGPQVFSSYGTESFFQPLFPYWDYITATNPYRYVSALAGDGDWDDPTHWQVDLDPAYRIIDANGNVVNGIPTTIGGGPEQDTPQFGEVCFDPEGANPGDGCQDLGSGDLTPPARETGEPVQSGIGQASLPGNPNAVNVSDLAAGGDAAASSAVVEQVAVNEAPAAAPELAVEQAQPKVKNDGLAVASASAPGARAGMIMGSENQAQDNGMLLGGENIAHNGVDLAEEQPQNGVDLAEEQPQASDGGEPEFTDTPNPAPTLDNGLVGATNFVPNNVDGPDGVLAGRRYFEVTLNQAGTTTLNSDRTIDRLNVGGAAGLIINTGASLTMENDVNQTGGRVVVDGMLDSFNDYTLFAGLLSGSGTVNAPFLTSIAGGIAPGTMGGIGTLDINGNVVLSSGSTLFIDFGPNGTSDLLRVSPTITNSPNPGDRDTSGATGNINVGGTVAFATSAFDRSAFNSVRYRIVEANRPVTATAGEPVTGTFNPLDVSAVLTADFIYGAQFVDVRLSVGNYLTAVDSSNAVQVSYASLMDQNRGNGALSGLFDFLDFADAATVQATFDSWAPTTESAVQNMARSSLDNAGKFYANRISDADRSSAGGTIAVIGQPLQLASASISGMNIPGSPAVMSDAAANSAATMVQEGGVDEDMAVYLAGGFIEGNGAGMPVANLNSRQTEFDGFFIAGGLEFFLSDDAMLGVSVYYSDIDGVTALTNQASGRTLMGSVYGESQFAGLTLDARLSAGTYNAQTRRNVALGPQNFTLTTDDDSFFFAAEAGLAKDIKVGGGTISPGIGMRATKINFDNVAEAGGGPALTIIRPDYESLQGLAGVEFQTSEGKPLQLRASGNFVHEFLNQPGRFAGSFVGGQGLPAPFALTAADRNWGEFGVGLRYNAGSVSFDLMADTTVGRGDVESQVYSAAATFRF